MDRDNSPINGAGRFQVRFALGADWEAVRQLCVESCQEPPFYLSANADWPSYTPDDWIGYAVGPDLAVTLLFDTSVAPPLAIGKARISTKNGDQTTAGADGIYIRPAYRGLGLAKLLWEARLAWARLNGIRRVTTIHRLSNRRSMKCVLAQGFTEIERIPTEDIPGASEPEIVYELWLETSSYRPG
jgi:GNAT superfamily N-acetyltransferase